MQEQFQQQAKTIHERLVNEKKTFDKKISILSEKLLSFEQIIREAAKNQTRLREQRNAYKSEVSRLRASGDLYS